MTNIGIVLIMVFLMAASILIFRDQEKLDVIKKNFTDETFITFFVIIVSLIVYGLQNKNNKVRISIRNGAIAFVTSYFSRLNMSYAVFFVVVIFVYFTGKDTKDIN